MTDDGVYGARKQDYFDKLDAETQRVYVVFAQGKTGTTTIAAALKRAGLHPVLQIHTLHPRALDKVEAEYLQRELNPHPRHVWEAQWLCARPPCAARPWSLITSVRDPVARLVSRYFQRESRFPSREEQPTAASIVAQLSAQFRRQGRRLDDPGWDWFDDELKPVLGQSVYETPFDPAIGYATIQTDHVRALVLRNESLDKAPLALAALEGNGHTFELRAQNVGAQKDYSALYREVLDQFRPPLAFVARVYDTQLARHFYSPDELDDFRLYWTRPYSSAP